MQKGRLRANKVMLMLCARALDVCVHESAIYPLANVRVARGRVGQTYTRARECERAVTSGQN